MQTKIRPASSDDIESIVEIENSTNLMPWTKAQFISSMEVGHYSTVLEHAETIIGFAKHGFGYLKLFVPSGVPVVLLPLIIIIEIISYLSRPISLSLIHI